MRGDASRHDSDDGGGLFGAPHVKFTSSAKLPNKVKVRKKFVLWPLKLKAGFDYDTRKDEFNFVGSCKETILGGRFGLDTGNREVTHRRLFKLGGGNALCHLGWGAWVYAQLLGLLQLPIGLRGPMPCL